MGWRSRPRPRGLVFVALLAGVSGACGEEVKPRVLDFHVGFACEADRLESNQLRLRVLAGGCETDASVL